MLSSERELLTELRLEEVVDEILGGACAVAERRSYQNSDWSVVGPLSYKKRKSLNIDMIKLNQ
jgi:hypothetical protein